MTVDPDITRTYIETCWSEDITNVLMDYIRIPNKSPAFDPNWDEHGYMQEAANLLTQWSAKRQIKGYHQEIVTLPGRTPVILCEIDATLSHPPKSANDSENEDTHNLGEDTHNQDEPCILLYGHYDKQPEFDGWHEGLDPWEPVLKDGKLYGRGGADDGYALFSSLVAIEALQQQNIPHPRCIVLIEGCEESGSFDLPYYMDHLKSRIGNTQLVICLDAECGNYDQLWATTSLRGMLPGTLRVDILKEGQHSGAAGGIVPSTFRIMRNVLDRIENSATGELHECLQVEIPQSVELAARDVAQVTGPEVVDRFPWVDGAHTDVDEWAELIVSNTWRPSLATVGLSGAPAVRDAGNTLRPNTDAKLVFRLPPTLDASEAAQRIKDVLEDSPPYGAHINFDLETAQTGWSAPQEAPWLADALAKTSQRHFNKPVMHMGCGGTIPFMKMLGDAYPSTQFFVTGVLGPKSNAHGPNEFLHLEMAKRITACVVDVIAAANDQWSNQEN